MSRIEEIETRLKAATQGPWEFDGNEINNVPDYESDNPAPWATVMECRVECMSYCYGGSIAMDITPENKALIESASADISYLLTAVKEQAAKLDALSHWAGRAKTGYYDEAQDDVTAILYPRQEA